MNNTLKNNRSNKPEERQGSAPEQQEPLMGNEALSQHALDEAELDSVAGGKPKPAPGLGTSI